VRPLLEDCVEASKEAVVAVGHFHRAVDCCVGFLGLGQSGKVLRRRMDVSTVSLGIWGVGSNLYGSSAQGAALGLVVMLKSRSEDNSAMEFQRI